jgi:hypothetical protein
MYQRPRACRPAPRRLGRRARVRPAALASLVVIFGLLLAQLVQISDLLLFQHSFCSHGELVHGPVYASAKAEAPEDGETTRLRAASLRRADNHNHEHCNAMAIRHCEGAPALHVPEAMVLGWTDTPPLVLGSPQRPIALLAVAPKASPPRG